jgi:hypothetical protein
MNAKPPSAPPLASAAQRPGWFWAVVLFAAAFAVELGLYAHPEWADALGLSVFLGWFLDFHALLAASDAWAAGFGERVFLHNPLDAYNRPHSYTNWWFVLAQWGLTRADLRWIGPLVVVTFTAVASAALRPTSARDLLIKLLFLVSPPVLLGIVRANNDLVIFVLLAFVPACLVSRSVVVQLLAPFLILFSAGLKFYPAVAVVVLLHGANPRLVLWRGVVAFAVALLVGLSVVGDTVFFSQSLPNPGGLYSFGAPVALQALGWGHPRAKLAVLLALVGGLWALCDGRASVRSWTARPDFDAGALAAVLGAVLLSGCFWAGMNWGYRWIFALWLLPALLRPTPHTWLLEGRLRIALLALLALCMWWDGAVFTLARFTRFGLTGADFIERSSWLIMPFQWACMGLLSLVVARFVLFSAWRLFARRDAGVHGPMARASSSAFTR